MNNSIEKRISPTEWREKEKESADKKKSKEQKEWSVKSKLEELKAEVITNREKKEAETLLTKLSWSQKENIKNKWWSIENDIRSLNRLEAEKWLIQSYTTIEDEIKNSKNEPGIAGFFGKIMNKIINW